ncbi:hypothetical protein [Bacillus pinisoli]|nr:hypothetical protein [Bacillus pinisoli]
MWSITKEGKGKFSTCNLLHIHDSDHDCEMALKEASEEVQDLFSL